MISWDVCKAKIDLWPALCGRSQQGVPLASDFSPASVSKSHIENVARHVGCPSHSYDDFKRTHRMIAKPSTIFLRLRQKNILFGGGAATIVLADIEIRHDHMFKPLKWMKGQPRFVPGRDDNPSLRICLSSRIRNVFCSRKRSGELLGRIFPVRIRYRCDNILELGYRYLQRSGK